MSEDEIYRQTLQDKAVTVTCSKDVIRFFSSPPFLHTVTMGTRHKRNEEHGCPIP